MGAFSRIRDTGRGEDMGQAVPLAEVWRGGRVESVHLGHAVVTGPDGQVEQAWGDPGAVIFPRSSCKMIQALPLAESGADLTPEQMALACASHQGAAVHVARVSRWLADMGMTDDDLRCGAHEPHDRDERDRLIRAHQAPCQCHNNCSGKHAGFLMMNRRIGGGPEYVEPDHPLQRMLRQVFEEVTGEASPGFGIDGCSAPNFATSVAGLARAMAAFAGAGEGSARGRAMRALTAAMTAHPDLVAGEGRACTELMRACRGRAALKTGAEAVFVAIIPGQRRGIALKVTDGGTRGAEAAITALLIRLGVLDPSHPAAQRRLDGPQANWRGRETGAIRRPPGFP